MLRRLKNEVYQIGTVAEDTIVLLLTLLTVEFSSTNNFEEQMEDNNKRTLQELAISDIVYQSWWIQRRPPQAFEKIPCGLFHNEAVGDTRGLHQNEGVPILLGQSNKRLPILFNIWGDMKRMFVEKFFLASRTATIKKEICLTMMDRSMIDAASGGALMDKMPAATEHLISNMASNTQ
ncbi:hypothetical protein CR513_43453, partial [Mucuna pruriens]